MAFLTFLFVANVLSTSQRSIYLSIVITRCWKIVHHKLFIDIIKIWLSIGEVNYSSFSKNVKKQNLRHNNPALKILN